MNLTPLIDVMFVILIMFIAVAPLLEVDRVELATNRQTEVSSILEKNPIAIHVYRDNSIAYNKHPVGLKQLEAKLQLAYEKYPKGRVQLFQDHHATFGTYQSVKNVVEKAGFAEIDVILKPE